MILREFLEQCTEDEFVIVDNDICMHTDGMAMVKSDRFSNHLECITEYGCEYFKTLLDIEVSNPYQNGLYGYTVAVSAYELGLRRIMQYFIFASCGRIGDKEYRKLFKES